MSGISPSLGAKLTRLVIIGMMVQMLVVAYVFYQGYQSRQDQVVAARAGCERGKLNNLANGAGWRTAQAARFADGDYEVALKYKRIADGLFERASINCNQAYPKASLLP